MAKHVPFSSGFMLTSILGFFISVFFVMDISATWGFTFALVFVLLFISSVVSMSHIEAEHKHSLKELAIHEKGHYVRKKGKK
ncbi:hypothetical protein KY348_00685 [Candidatus Woesearchaeota archaeon]|nr:hypothetical protein [Candidatus Woesearchaeota archaeon]